MTTSSSVTPEEEVLYLTEESIASFLDPFVTQRQKLILGARKQLTSAVIAGVVGVLTIFASAIVMNFPAYLERTRTSGFEPVQVVAAATATPTVLAVIQQPTSTPTPVPTATPVATPDIANDTIFIEKLGLSLPLQPNVNTGPKSVEQALLKGAIHLGGTSPIGSKGAGYITAHSSYYGWAKSDYKRAFAKLDGLSEGDMVHVRTNNVTYTYKVSGTTVVPPTAVGILTEQSWTGINLGTCWPLGTTRERLIVSAVQVSPDPALNADFTPPAFNQNLPTAR